MSRGTLGALGSLGLVLFVAAGGCTDRGRLAAPTLEPLDVRAEGSWIRDRRGRVVVLRGVTLSSLEPGRFLDEPGGPTDADFAAYEAAGFNVVRLLLSWPELESDPGGYEHGYFMERVNPVVRLAAKRGMLAILGVEGLPGERADAICDLVDDTAEAPSDLRRRFRVGWGNVVEFYGDDRRIVAFDLLGEPREEDCASGSSGDQLWTLYRDVARKLRRRGAHQSLFFDPSVRAGALLPRVIAGGWIAAAFAPHFFSQTFGPPQGAPATALRRAYSEGAAIAREHGVVFFVGEIGADDPPEADGFRPASVPFVRASLDALDRQLAGGTIRLGGEPESASWRAAAMLAAVGRPWARRIAGIPTAMRLDPESRSYHLAFRDDPSRRVADPTEVFVPRGFYPEGFAVQVLPSGRWSYDAHSQRLLVYRSGASGHVLRIDPSPTHSSDTSED